MSGVKPPDPMGKRALFWAPAMRDDPSAPPEGDGRPPEELGRRALFSAVAGPGATRAGSSRGGAARAPGSGFGWPFGVELTCSRCGAQTAVDPVRFALLHLPLWLWLPVPGRAFTRLIRCPSCAHRSWMKAALRLA